MGCSKGPLEVCGRKFTVRQSARLCVFLQRRVGMELTWGLLGSKRLEGARELKDDLPRGGRSRWVWSWLEKDGSEGGGREGETRRWMGGPPGSRTEGPVWESGPRMLEVETTGVGCHWRGQGLGVKREWVVGLVVGR